MSEKEPIPGNPDAKLPDADNPYDRPMWRAIKRGLAGGALVGYVIARYVMDAHSIETPVGPVYGGNVLLVFAVWIGFGSAVGVGIDWLSQQTFDDNDRRPPPDVARTP